MATTTASPDSDAAALGRMAKLIRVLGLTAEEMVHLIGNKAARAQVRRAIDDACKSKEVALLRDIIYTERTVPLGYPEALELLTQVDLEKLIRGLGDGLQQAVIRELYGFRAGGRKYTLKETTARCFGRSAEVRQTVLVRDEALVRMYEVFNSTQVRW